ncbi:MAG TPA: hypothetical protein VFO60_06605, partial [Candidatus Dormibacteraeota bacterium]|nr:hypothetical protein [Candidatus Dormibacteraeota bacterium]
MPELPSDPAKPWLDSLTVCALTDEAEAVRRLLKERGLTTRAVPSGRARLAWTCVEGDRIHGIVVSGVGAEQARRSATFWMHRSRVLVILGVTAGTGLTALPVTALEGSDWMVARARSAVASGDPPVVLSHVAAAAPGTHTEEARRSLADAGIAATLPEVDVWRDAAERFGAEAVVIAGLIDPAELDPHALARIPTGAA